MNKEDITERLKHRFCKNYNIPISIFKEPYFEDRIKLYDKYFGTVNKWNEFVLEMKEYKNEQDYLEEYNKVKDSAINYIKSQKWFEMFNNDNFNKYKVDSKFNSNNIYKEQNDLKEFISIDIKKANFTCLKAYNESSFSDFETYEDFISEFTNKKSMIDSKYMRQVIFGNINPKRQITYEKYLMNKVMQIILFNDESCYKYVGKFLYSPFEESDVVSFQNDEIVLYNNKEIKEGIFNIELSNKENIVIKIEKFKLRKFDDVYLKEYGDGKIEIKCGNHLNIPFIIRKLNNEDIQENDLYFFYENRLAKFVV